MKNRYIKFVYHSVAPSLIHGNLKRLRQSFQGEEKSLITLPPDERSCLSMNGCNEGRRLKTKKNQ